MRIRISHRTTYHFDQPVPYALQRLRLCPKDSAGQTILDWRMDIDGGRCEAEYDDQHHNHVALVSVHPGVQTIDIQCSGEVETDPANHGVIGRHRGHVPLWLFARQTPRTRPGAAMQAIVQTLRGDDRSNALARLHHLSAIIRDTVAYETGRTDSTTTGEQAAAAGHGVCQDHAHIFIGVARALGHPARYVSGYLFMEDRVEQEAGHAWAEAWIDNLGWVGFDISNGISPDQHYVRVATGLDYADAAPISAMSFGARDTSLIVNLRIDQ